MGIAGDDRYTSGDRCVHKDGRTGKIIRPAGGDYITVWFTGDTEYTTIHVNDLKEPARARPD